MVHKKKKNVKFISIYVETLTGTVFEVKVSPKDQVQTLKNKIQQLEGIPSSQQHLLWQSVELKNDALLSEYKITNGSTLQLVLGMKGGPISIKPVSNEEVMLKEMSEYVEANKDALMDSTASDSHVTLLVFREGESINVVKVIERSDGSLSPLSNTNSYPESDVSESVRFQKLCENDITREKMNMLRNQMAAIYRASPEKEILKQTGQKIKRKKRSSKLSSKYRYHSVRDSKKTKHNSAVHLPFLRSKYSRQVELNQDTGVSQDIASQPLAKHFVHHVNEMNSNAGPSSHINKNSKLLSNSTRVTTGTKMNELRQILDSQQDNNMKSDHFTSFHNSTRPILKSSWVENEWNHSPENEVSLLDSLRKLNLGKNQSDFEPPIDRRNLKSSNMNATFNNKLPLPSIRSSINGDKSERLNGIDNNDKDKLQSSVSDHVNDNLSKSGAAVRAFMVNILNKKFSSSIAPKDDESSSYKGYKVAENSSKDMHDSMNSTLLPQAAISKPVHKSTKKKCAVCQKKIGLATSYTCRCDKNFCSTHRYPEVHSCTHDYKSEGRKILEKNNPLIIASKVSKI